jgi:hypothetical protein
MKPPSEMTMFYDGASFSEDGRHRYRLSRLLTGSSGSTALFVMLNPSTADASINDPTVRRCIGFAHQWGFGRLVVVNLFSLRSTDPKALYADPEKATGDPTNWSTIATCAGDAADLVVCAWGAHGALHGRGERIAGMLRRLGRPHHLGLTNGGHPRHPLYLRGDTQPVPWQ